MLLMALWEAPTHLHPIHDLVHSLRSAAVVFPGARLEEDVPDGQGHRVTLAQPRRRLPPCPPRAARRPCCRRRRRSFRGPLRRHRCCRLSCRSKEGLLVHRVQPVGALPAEQHLLGGGGQPDDWEGRGGIGGDLAGKGPPQQEVVQQGGLEARLRGVLQTSNRWHKNVAGTCGRESRGR